MSAPGGDGGVTPEMWSAIANWLVAVAALMGAIAAWVGLNTWQKERRWEVDHSLSRQFLLALRKRQDAFNFLRSPLVSSAEMRQAFGEDYDPFDKKKSDDAWLAAINSRLSRLEEAGREMYPFEIEAAYLWGDSISSPSARIIELERDVSIALQEIARNMRSRSECLQLSPEERERDVEIRKVAFGMPTSDVGIEYQREVTALENVLKSKLGR
ncbi:MAG TPA: hypothetical protein ENJ52_10340 [Aliiroseovarius sp.]|nr:hypothetical protein [Aliiroseovarius sp.]